MTDLFRIPYELIKPIYRWTSFHRSVIDEIDDERLKNAYSECRAITRHHAKTFYMATRFLPNHKQRGIFAIYSLCRYIDDLVDEAEDLLEQKELTEQDIRLKLQSWKQKLKDTYEGRSHDNAILIAFSDVLKRYHIPIEMPFELMEGVCMDLFKDRYETFNELYDYSFKVASIVGLMTSQVFGYKNQEALSYAVDLGIAMQLTNILRDVGEDLERNRIYLPQEDLQRFGVTEQDLFNHALEEPVIKLLQFQIERTRRYYNRSDKGIALLSNDSQLPVYLARQNYSRILNKIEENDYNVFDTRAYLNTTEKLSILPRAYYQMKVGKS
ncbi:phytoene/squalene synthase family protein [Fodinibius halophilus]|uniref:Squalene/phytoene synthase family protein n=1 Tax=Fodinibius halophilus TaxID=1736908 RepID=A0A6M1TFJ3_9BACT|nr:squalene/phytoene synthase family protein [Fodinibius halophilus]NGP88902.1 squalene/phytoene synthase family protein [Fodinibius halophilus]